MICQIFLFYSITQFFFIKIILRYAKAANNTTVSRHKSFVLCKSGEDIRWSPIVVVLVDRRSGVNGLVTTGVRLTFAGGFQFYFQFKKIIFLNKYFLINQSLHLYLQLHILYSNSGNAPDKTMYESGSLCKYSRNCTPHRDSTCEVESGLCDESQKVILNDENFFQNFLFFKFNIKINIKSQ